MRPLATIQQVFAWLGAPSSGDSVGICQRLAYSICPVFLFVMSMCALASSMTYFGLYASVNLEDSLYALFQVFAYISMTYVLIVMPFLRHKIREILETLAKIHKSNEKEPSYHFLAQANKKGEGVWRLYATFVMGGYLLNTIMLCLIPILFSLITVGHIDMDHLYHPLKMTLPWDQKTFTGYLGGILCFIVNSEIYFIVNGAMLLLFISICWHHQAFYKMFHHSISQPFKGNLSDHDSLCKVIRFHVAAKNWFLASAEVYSSFILVQMIFSMMLTATTIFQLDLELKHIDFNFCILLMAMVNGVANLFFFCFFGKMATESFEMMANSLFESDWRKLPTKLQKYLILMIANTQKPIYYDGFGITVLHLGTFCNFIKTVCTYYLMFKTLTTT